VNLVVRCCDDDLQELGRRYPDLTVTTFVKGGEFDRFLDTTVPEGMVHVYLRNVSPDVVTELKERGWT